MRILELFCHRSNHYFFLIGQDNASWTLLSLIANQSSVNPYPEPALRLPETMEHCGHPL